MRNPMKRGAARWAVDTASPSIIENHRDVWRTIVFVVLILVVNATTRLS
jgi:hypothetical protein